MAAVAEEWVPKTRIGMLVKEGRITSIDEIFENNLPIKEPEIIDILLPELKHEIIDVNWVQRQTDAGEVSRFQVTVVVGNENGYVGIGMGKAKEIRVAIEKALRSAKLNIMPVRRGCGSWECSCGEPHSVPFKVVGKSGSVEVTILPAPKGVGLVAGDSAKVVMRLAGIQDAWTRTKGETRTTHNMAKAVYNALKQTYKFKVPAEW